MDGMELAFNTKDVIYIIGFVVTGLSAWFKVKIDKEKMSNEIFILEKEMLKCDEQFKHEVLNAKNGRRATKKEAMEYIDKAESTLHSRIDRVRDDNLKSYDKLELKITELDKKYDVSTLAIITAIQNSKNV